MPLAERMRPKSLDELVGHEDLVGENGVLRELILSDRVPSMILWAGPGVKSSRPLPGPELTGEGWQNDPGSDRGEHH